MKKFNEFVEVQTTVTELLELNKPLLLKKAQEEVAEAQKQEDERVAALLQRFILDLRPAKVECNSLLEQYIEQRRGYVKSKLTTSITSFTNIFSSKKTDLSEKININSLQESQSSAGYQTAFSSLPADQYSLALYHKINAHLDDMVDYDSTVKATLGLATLLTNENKSKSENLMNMLKSILQILIPLIQYDKFEINIVKLRVGHPPRTPHAQIPSIFFHHEIGRVYNENGDYYGEVFNGKIHLYGCQGKNWTFSKPYIVAHTWLDEQTSFHEEFLMNGAHLPDEARFGQYIKTNITAISLGPTQDSYTTALQNKIDNFIAYYPVHYLYGLLDKNPTLKLFHDSLQELHRFDLIASSDRSDPFSMRQKIYDKAISLAQNLGIDYVSLLNGANSPTWNPAPEYSLGYHRGTYRPFPSEYLTRDASDKFFIKVLQTYTGNQFLTILCDKLKEEFTPVVNHESSSRMYHPYK